MSAAPAPDAAAARCGAGGGIQGTYVLSQDADSRIVDIWLELSVPRF